MKRTDGFDASRLRTREHRSLASRLSSMFGLLLVTLGLFLVLIGAASLVSSHAALSAIAVAREVAVTFLVVGIISIWCGILIRRRVRRRLHAPSGLSLSPRLMKKRN